MTAVQEPTTSLSVFLHKELVTKFASGMAVLNMTLSGGPTRTISLGGIELIGLDTILPEWTSMVVQYIVARVFLRSHDHASNARSSASADTSTADAKDVNEILASVQQRVT